MKQILQYLKRRHVTDTQTINRLFVTAFITINQQKVSNNSYIHQYLIAADEEISKNLKLEDNKIISLDEYKSNNISNKIKKFLEENNDIGTIITFDETGVGFNEHSEC